MDKTKGFVDNTYVKWVSVSLKRIYKKHNISIAMRPHITSENVTVHPKAKRNLVDTMHVVL